MLSNTWLSKVSLSHSTFPDSMNYAQTGCLNSLKVKKFKILLCVSLQKNVCSSRLDMRPGS